MRNEKGFSIIEMMVALVIAGFILAGVVQVFVNGKRSFEDQAEFSFMQENLRFALDIIAQDVRMASYFGCLSVNSIANSLSNSDQIRYNSQGIQGFEGEVAANSVYPAEFFAGAGINEILFAGLANVDDSANNQIRPDAIVVNFGDPVDAPFVESHNPYTRQFMLSDAAAPEFEVGDIVVVNNPECREVAITQITGINNDTLSYGGGGVPGNCTSFLAGYEDCNNLSRATNSVTFSEYSPLMRYRSRAYYIADSPTTGMPTLYRQNLTTDSAGTSATWQTEELVSGIENLQILYGVDTDDTPDQVVNRYVKAGDANGQISDVEATGPSTTGGNDNLAWERVMSVRITITLRSMGNVFDTATQQLDVNGLDYNDRRLYLASTATVKLRNRGLN